MQDTWLLVDVKIKNYIKMSYPLVSILIPCYNAEKFLDETLHCCVEQTYSNTEIIVVDDGSTDDSLEKLKRWESKYQQIHVYTQTNQGAAHTRNVALDKSQGEYVMYLDADDIVSLNKVENQVKILMGGVKAMWHFALGRDSTNLLTMPNM